MYSDFIGFINTRLARVTGGAVPVRLVYLHFLESLGDSRERQVWPRWRFVEELREAGLSVCQRNKVAEIVGFSLLPPPNAKSVTVTAGMAHLSRVNDRPESVVEPAACSNS
jgi:hypothetical protein